MLKRVKNQKGFTLIELIAVIAILGILALLIVPRVGNYTQQAQASKAKGDITILKNAIERYNAEHTTALSGTLADSEDELTGKTDAAGSSGGSLGPYIDKLPPTTEIPSDSTIDNIMKYNTDSITKDTTLPLSINP